jgi:hypothetical protein
VRSPGAERIQRRAGLLIARECEAAILAERRALALGQIDMGDAAPAGLNPLAKSVPRTATTAETAR